MQQTQEKVQLTQEKESQEKVDPQEKEKEERLKYVLHKTLPMKKAFTLKDKLNSVNSNLQ